MVVFIVKQLLLLYNTLVDLWQMSGLPTINIVDDDEVSLQGSINALVVAPTMEAQVQALAR